MIFQILLGTLSFHLVQGFSNNQYFVNTGPSSLTSGSYGHDHEPRSVYYYTNDINKPIFHVGLGMDPQYHNLVYHYIKDFGGTELPSYTFQPSIFHSANDIISDVKATGNVKYNNILSPSINNEHLSISSDIEQVTDKPGLQTRYLPSDLLSLPGQRNKIHQYDAMRTGTVKSNLRPTSLPPLGGVISNYVLLRNHPNYRNLLQLPEAEAKNEYLEPSKRESPDYDDSVVILAEQTQNPKTVEEMTEQKEEMAEIDSEKEDEKEMQTSIAQSKPSGIALAGPGGVAQASPVGTAVVGPGGLAVAAPSGTAVAGASAQHALSSQSETTKKRKEDTEASDSD